MDLEDDTPFDKTQWIGKKRRYSDSTTPGNVIWHVNSLRDMPVDVQSQYFPDARTTVALLLELQLPPESTGLLTKKAALWFTSRLPNQDLAQTLGRAIPKRATVTAMYKEIGQHILDGKQSIEDPSHRNIFLPLFAVDFWRQMYVLKDGQKMWREGHQWIEECLRTAKDDDRRQLEDAQVNLATIRWDEPLCLPGLGDGEFGTTLSLARLLNNRWMNDTLINLMFHQLSERLEDDEDMDGVVAIYGLRFITDILRAKSAKDHESDKPLSAFLGQIERRVLEGNLETILFPVHLKEKQHWVAFEIDFAGCRLSCGNSMSHIKGMKIPTDIITKLKWWLSLRIGGKFEYFEDGLRHGHQLNDTHNCGIVTVNTVAHAVFEDPLWKNEDSVAHRIKWFNHLVTTQKKIVNSRLDEKDYPDQSLRNNSDRSALAVTDRMNISHLLNESPAKSPVVEQPGPSCDADIDSMVLDTLTIDTDLSPVKVLPAPPLKRTRAPTLENPAPSLSESNAGVAGPLRTSKKRRIGTEVESASTDEANRDEANGRGYLSACNRARVSISQRLSNPINSTATLLPALTRRHINFKARILQITSSADIVSANAVRHLACGKKLFMKRDFHVTNFKRHVKNCKGPTKGSQKSVGMKSLGSYAGFSVTPKYATPSSSTKSDPDAPVQCPCPGITSSLEPKVATYCARTGAKGGGAPSLTVLADQIYGKEYRDLPKARQLQVKLAQQHDWAWSNDHDNGRVFSTDCLREASLLPEGVNGPCIECMQLLKNRKFRNAIAVPIPDDANYKFLNHEYRNNAVGLTHSKSMQLQSILKATESKAKSPLIKYISGVLAEEYKGDDLFAALLHAMARKVDKSDRKVGSQNFKWSPTLIEFAQIVYASSPKSYRFIKEHMPLPSTRFLQVKRSKSPRLPIGITDKTFERVLGMINALDYSGPVALSCDDTKLMACLNVYRDDYLDGHYILGCTGDPYRLTDLESFKSVVESGILIKATKLRLFCLKIPIPKVPAIILAALAVGNSEKAEDLFGHLWKIIQGLLENGIKVSSYAADGSTVERSVQNLLVGKADRTIHKHIDHPGTGGSFSIPIHFFRGQPIAILQDAKHYAKTSRNNLFSGARMLTFVNHVATYPQVRKMAFADDGPLYKRDVEKLDRQDDSAATRLHSAATLEWLFKHAPEDRGLIIYLFITGELVDAYENRTITHLERVEMVLRARFFFEIWELYLDTTEHPRNKHHFSPQCRDITGRVIEGFMQALYIYRDHTDGPRPFLPWDVLTEILEHVFGFSRNIVKDFHLRNFYDMIPKLELLIRQAAFNANATPGKDRASGYCHTYTDIRGVDLQNLASYPSDAEINEASVRVYGQVESLFFFMGVIPQDINGAAKAAKNKTAFCPTLPSISDFFADDDNHNGSDVESDSEADDSTDEDDEDLAISRSLHLASQKAESLKSVQEHDERRIMNLQYAVAAFAIQDQKHIEALPEYTVEQRTEVLAEDAERIGALLASSLPGPNIQPKYDKPSNPLLCSSNEIELGDLVTLRRAHQTRQAETGIRVRKAHGIDTSGNMSEKQKESAEKLLLLRQFHEVIRKYEADTVAIGTGMVRKAHWQSVDSDASAMEPEVRGNAANAAFVANEAAKKKLKKRVRTVKSKRFPANLEEMLCTGGINSLPDCHLRAADSETGVSYAWVLSSGAVMLGKVLCIYQKLTGKGARHAYCQGVDNIGAASNIGLQIYQQAIGAEFRSHFTSVFTCKFDILHPTRFLCGLTCRPSETSSGLRISSQDLEIMKLLKNNITNVHALVKALEKGGDGLGAEDD